MKSIIKKYFCTQSQSLRNAAPKNTYQKVEKSYQNDEQNSNNYNRRGNNNYNNNNRYQKNNRPQYSNYNQNQNQGQNQYQNKTKGIFQDNNQRFNKLQLEPVQLAEFNNEEEILIINQEKLDEKKAIFAKQDYDTILTDYQGVLTLEKENLHDYQFLLDAFKDNEIVCDKIKEFKIHNSFYENESEWFVHDSRKALSKQELYQKTINLINDQQFTKDDITTIVNKNTEENIVIRNHLSQFLQNMFENQNRVYLITTDLKTIVEQQLMPYVKNLRKHQQSQAFSVIGNILNWDRQQNALISNRQISYGRNIFSQLKKIYGNTRHGESKLSENCFIISKTSQNKIIQDLVQSEIYSNTIHIGFVDTDIEKSDIQFENYDILIKNQGSFKNPLSIVKDIQALEDIEPVTLSETPTA